MTRKFIRNFLRSIAIPFTASLVVLAATTTWVETTSAAPSSAKTYTGSTTRDMSASEQALKHLALLRSGNAARPHQSVGSLMDSLPPLFLPAVAYASGGNVASALAVGDFNGDGKPDLVVVNDDNEHFPGSVSVLLGNGDGSFQPAITYDSGGGQPQSVAVADVNNDGIQDVVVLNLCADSDCNGIGSIEVLLGNGNGTFQKTAPFKTVAQMSIAVADLNADGNADLVVTRVHSGLSVIGVHLGHGDGTFSAGVTYETGGNGSGALAVADINGDGKPDVVTANFDSSDVSVLIGKGDGTFQPSVIYASGGLHSRQVAIADVNGDGKPDLLVANTDSSSIGVLLGVGDGTFKPAVSYAGGDEPYSVVV